MNRLILGIFNWLRRHAITGWAFFLALTLTLVWSVAHLDYKEDITDFLPLDSRSQEAMGVYRSLSGAERIFAIVSASDHGRPSPALLTEGVDRLVDNIRQADSLGWVSDMTWEIDLDSYADVADMVMTEAPLFLTDSDYARLDSALARPGYFDSRMAEVKEQLLLPSGGMLADNLGRDPLGLFTPLLERLMSGSAKAGFETYDGYILTPDSLNAIVMIESAFGGQESDGNARLLEMLESAAMQMQSDIPQLSARYLGGPVIAVGNASCIKTDSILAVSIAGLLILALLIYAFRDMRNILLIVVSVGWGWLFAMGLIAAFYSSISIIVIGIASVILGIAVNYPLHLIDHIQDSSDTRRAMSQVASPLLIGNITTVGAFLCLVPLQSPALHDLGLFSSLLLVGTIVFVLVFLPHAVRVSRSAQSRSHGRLLERLAGFSIENSRWTVAAVTVLTLVFAWFSTRTGFDTDLSNINYMTDSQRADMQHFQKLFYTADSARQTLYVVSSADSQQQALEQNETLSSTIDSIEQEYGLQPSAEIDRFIPSKSEQARRLNLLADFLGRHPALTDSINAAAKAHGFSDDAFAEFEDIVTAAHQPLSPDSMGMLSQVIFAGNLAADSSTGRFHVVRTLNVDAGDIDAITARIAQTPGFDGACFDIKSMSATVANTLTDNFNYICIVCGLIVFLFLWLSLGNFELAVISFIPMAVSWIWILGIMAMLDMRFNLVNIILATFIFGQGDDYTIFMTEGLCYEFAYGRRLLASYKKSIIMSALIMFIGIGCLVFARHPAMRSLGEVTIVGMISVVVMAYLFPPLLFNFLVKRRDGQLRRQPLSLALLWRRIFSRNSDELTRLSWTVLDRYRFKGADIFRRARRNIRALLADPSQLDVDSSSATIDITDNGQGEKALLLALMHPHIHFNVTLPDADAARLLRGSARDLAPNIKIDNA